MPQRSEDRPIVAEQLFELRHEASGTFLDVRGFVADYLRKHKFPHWRIDTNSISFHDAPQGVQKDGAFVGYKSLGYYVHNADTKNYFVDKAIAFWKVLLENGHYEIPSPSRFGARAKLFLPREHEFEEINKRIFKTFIAQDGVHIFGATPTDIQINIDLNEAPFSIRCVLGPTHKGEAGNFFPFESKEFEKAGIFLDLDIYTTTDLALDKVPDLLRRASDVTWAKLERLEQALEI